tara:strand:- start:345 stop:446 length:102 start_codon:yes stop_codon:yes gene_type:complete
MMIDFTNTLEILGATMLALFVVAVFANTGVTHE